MELNRASGKKKMIGVVVKDKMEKTIVVEAEKFKKHSKYHKYIRTKKRYKAHDEENRCKVGDTVLIEETRPLSKDKRWLVKEIVRKEEPIVAIQEEVIGDDTGKD